MDRRTEAAKTRALSLLIIERNRVREALDDEQAGLEMAQLLGLPGLQVAACKRRIRLLEAELAELSPDPPKG